MSADKPHEAFRDHLVSLAVEAWDRVVAGSSVVGFRDAFASEARERMNQAAQTYALDVSSADLAGYERGYLRGLAESPTRSTPTEPVPACDHEFTERSGGRDLCRLCGVVR